MTTAGAVASELRRIADVLDRNADIEIKKPDLSFFHFSEKDEFLRLAKIFPRPFSKDYGNSDDNYSRIMLTHSTDAVDVVSSIYRSAVCTLVRPAQPAEYDCEPLLSEDEESGLVEETA